MRIIGLIALQDQQAFARYRAAVSATVELHGGRVVGRSVPVHTFWDELSCGPLDAVVELDFPDLDSARRWAESAEYTAILGDRKQAMRLLLFAVQPA